MKIVVVGAGPGGYVAAIKAALLGAEVTVIEKYKPGGTCLNWGCIPTKSLLAASERIDMVKEAEDFGVEIGSDIKVDFNKIMDRKNKIVTNLVKGIEHLFAQRKITVVKGHGKILSSTEVLVTDEDNNTQTIPADKIIIATGSAPIVPPMFPYDKTKVITSDEAMNLTEIPKSMIIVGGGVIGCEFGQFYRKLGTEITIVEMADYLLPFEDDDVAKQLARSFKKDKIKVMTSDSITKVEVNDNGVTAELGSGKSLTAELMIVSVGRRPYLDNLGVEELGLASERGKLIVDENMMTNVDGIYAIGDVINSPMLAHVASKEGLVAVDHAVGKKSSVNYDAVPRCVYTDPEVAAVGKTERELTEKGIAYHVGSFEFRGLGKAQAIGKLHGSVKVLTDDNDVIVGASVVGPHATDLLTELTLSVHLKLTAAQVGDVIHPHPTLSEALMEALHDVHGQCVHKV